MKRLVLVLVIGSSFSVQAMDMELKEAHHNRRMIGTRGTTAPEVQLIAIYQREIEDAVLAGQTGVLCKMNEEQLRYPSEIWPRIKEGIVRIDAFNHLKDQADQAKEAIDVAALNALKENISRNPQLKQEDRERAVKMFGEYIKQLEVNQALMSGDLVRMRIMQKKYPYDFSQKSRGLIEARQNELFGAEIPCNVETWSGGVETYQPLSTQGVIEQAANAEREEDIAVLQEMLKKADEIRDDEMRYSDLKCRYKILIQASIDRVKAVLQKKEFEAQKKRAEEKRAEEERAARSNPAPVVEQPAHPANNGWFATARSWFARPAIKIASAAATFVAGILLYKKYAGRSAGAAAR